MLIITLLNVCNSNVAIINMAASFLFIFVEIISLNLIVGWIIQLLKMTYLICYYQARLLQSKFHS